MRLDHKQAAGPPSWGGPTSRRAWEHCMVREEMVLYSGVPFPDAILRRTVDYDSI